MSMAPGRSSARAAFAPTSSPSGSAPSPIGPRPMASDGVTAFAPGRVNLIGEHTDYNQGLALVGLGAAACPDGRRLAEICSRVENEWVGARTGLLDQLASIHGAPDAALRIDFRSVEIRTVALELGGWRLVTLDSGDRHANA